MKAKIEAAIGVLLGRIDGNMTADEALKFTQAALNLSHTAATLDEIERNKK
jgi:hypothetical protein